VRTLKFQQVPYYDILKNIIGDFSFGLKALQIKILDKYIQTILEEA
jgi:hypothetical protein